MALAIVLSCEKDKLHDPIYNDAVEVLDKELFVIDSSATYPGMGSAYKALKVYFHINYQYIKDTSQINNVTINKNNGTFAQLNPTQRTWFGDGMALKGSTYTVCFSLRNKKLNNSQYSGVYSFPIPYW